MSRLSRAQQADRDEAIGDLRKILKPGDELVTLIRHVARSGMSRSISVVFARRSKRGSRGVDIGTLDHTIARAIGHRIDGNHGGIVMGGAGMDMGFHLVYILGLTLWPNGTPKPHGRRNGEPDSNGGYALKHRWL